MDGYAACDVGGCEGGDEDGADCIFDGGNEGALDGTFGCDEGSCGADG